MKTATLEPRAITRQSFSFSMPSNFPGRDESDVSQNACGPTNHERPTIYALRERDAQTLNNFFKNQSNRIFAVIYRIVRNKDDAKDLVQETFSRAFRSLDTFRGQAKLETWLYGVALNVARAHLQKKYSRRRVLNEKIIDWVKFDYNYKETSDSINTDWNPEFKMEKEEESQITRKAIDQLREAYREVLNLRDLEGLSTTEVAEALSISEVNVRVRLHRARRALREQLALNFCPIELEYFGR